MKLKSIFLILILSININAKEVQKLVWPSAPDPARIEFKALITSPEDLEFKKGIFTKAWEFFAGSSEEERFVKPFGLHVDENQRLYISDTGTRVVSVLDTKKNKKFIIEGTKKHKFLSPMDIDTDKNGNIYISDSVLGFVYVYNKKGKYLRKIGEGKKLHRPVGIAIDNELKVIYIVDTLASKIQVYSLLGKYIKTIGKEGIEDGAFNKPTYIALDDDGNLYICDSMNHRVQIIDKNGKFISKFGKIGDTLSSLANPRGITIDSNGNIFVTDTTFHVVKIFNKKGQLLLVLGHYGEKRGEFAIPEDITISSEGIIYIADSYNMRVQVLKLLKNVKSGG